MKDVQSSMPFDYSKEIKKIILNEKYETYGSGIPTMRNKNLLEIL